MTSKTRATHVKDDLSQNVHDDNQICFPLAGKLNRWETEAQQNGQPKFTSSELQEMKKFEALALHAYDANGDQELTLRSGDLIHVWQASTDHAGWWAGYNCSTRRYGWFPGSYVQAVKPLQHTSADTQADSGSPFTWNSFNRQLHSKMYLPTTTVQPSPIAPQRSISDVRTDRRVCIVLFCNSLIMITVTSQCV